MYGKLTVNLQSVKTLGDIVTRHLNIVEGSTEHNQAKGVTMLQLTSWPMKGLPHASLILSLIEKLTAAQMKSTNKRRIVICRYRYGRSMLCLYILILSSFHSYSDGMSRTGTFLIIHSQIERLKTEGVVDILQAVKSARLQRAGLVLNAVSLIELQHVIPCSNRRIHEYIYIMHMLKWPHLSIYLVSILCCESLPT